MRPRFLHALILTLALLTLRAPGESITLEPWYPLLGPQGKWGFIDSRGNWKITPAYDYTCDIFDHDLVRVMVDKKWGYINRQGKWAVKPQFDCNYVSPYFEYGNFQAVSCKKKFGIVSREGQLVLPLRYDEVVLSTDRAWVRNGNRLGIYGLDGHWFRQLDIPWPAYQTTPQPLNSDGVAWFQDHADANGKWGLINGAGKIVFDARFESHRFGRNDFEDWNHPEGTDFVHGHAWVFENDSFELISAAGEIGAKQPFRSVSRWAGNLSRFTTNDSGLFGLVSDNGGIILPAQACEIKTPSNGLARYNWKSWSITGFLDAEGRPVIPAGQYGFPQDPCEGLIAATRQATRSTTSRVSDPRGIFLDLTGKEVPLTNDKYFAVGSFSDGLAAAQRWVEVAPGSTPKRGKWGYIDRNGTEKIPPQFGSVSRFCQGRAWVSLADHSSANPVSPDYALIDASGKILTAFQFEPPDLDRPGIEVDTANLPDVRWRGNLVVLDGGWQVGYGLAKADGTVLIPPQFNALGPFADGMVECIRLDLKSGDRWMGYSDSEGHLAIPAIYSGGTDFEKGSAWVTLQPNDHRVHAENLGWFLIDHQGRKISSDSYLSPSFLAGEHYSDMGGLTGVPHFIGDLACVASAKTYLSSDDDRLRHSDWGYIDHAGNIVAWHKAEIR